MQKSEMNLLSDRDYLSIIEVSNLLSIPEQILIEWIEHDVVSAEFKQTHYYLRCDELNKVKSALRLTRDLGVNAPGIAIIMRLRGKIKRLEALVDRFPL